VVRDSFDTKAGRVVVGLLAEGWTQPGWPRPAWPSWVRSCRPGLPAIWALAGRLIGRAASALPAHPAATAGKQATLAGLGGALAALDGPIARLEAEMAPLLAATQAPSAPRSAGGHGRRGRVRCLGWPHRPLERVVQALAGGLDPARSQSGATDQSYGISREGSAWAGERSWSWPPASAASQTLPHQLPGPAPCPQAPKVALAAVGNQVGRTCLALMGSGADDDPDHQAKRISRRTGNQPKAGGRAA
jgi:hypothetical protein